MAFVKDPGEVKDYAIDWTAHLATSETITTSTWVVATGITKDSDSATTTVAMKATSASRSTSSSLTPRPMAPCPTARRATFASAPSSNLWMASACS